MKRLVSIISVFCFSGFALAGNMQQLKKTVPNGTWVGNSGKDYKCSISTEWLASGDLKVVANLQYQKDEPRAKVVLFKESKDATVSIGNGELDPNLQLSQETVLLEEDDYKVSLYETLSVYLEDGKIEGLYLESFEVDFTNDPHEDSVQCSSLVKTN